MIGTHGARKILSLKMARAAYNREALQGLATQAGYGDLSGFEPHRDGDLVDGVLASATNGDGSEHKLEFYFTQRGLQMTPAEEPQGAGDEAEQTELGREATSKEDASAAPEPTQPEGETPHDWPEPDADGKFPDLELAKAKLREEAADDESQRRELEQLRLERAERNRKERLQKIVARVESLDDMNYTLARKEIAREFDIPLGTLDNIRAKLKDEHEKQRAHRAPKAVDDSQQKPNEGESGTADREFFRAPTHGAAADILYSALHDSWVFERHTDDGRGEFWARKTCYLVEVVDPLTSARRILEETIERTFEAEKAQASGREINDIFSQAGKATSKARTRDFLRQAVSLLAERLTVHPSIPWNATPECLPTLTGILDFSGPEPVIRGADSGEFFRDPVPCSAEEIISGGDSPRFDQFMIALFPNTETRRSGLACASMLIAHRASKVFQLWHNADGDGGKNTFVDFLRQLAPERIVMGKGALILYKGDSGQRRFGAYAFRGASGIVFDEVGGSFDIGEIKQYTSLSAVSVEAKGKDSIEIAQTWCAVALCNTLPKFFPPNDGAFLARLFVLPFGSVFYTDEADR